MQPRNYKVMVTQDITQSVEVVVAATSPEEAGTKAIEFVRNAGHTLDNWVTADGPCSEPYLADEDGDIREDDGKEIG